MIINCTPHNINIYSTADCYIRDGFLCFRVGALDDEGEFPQPFLTYPAAKEPARVIFIQKHAGMADGIHIYRWVPDEIVNLPGPKPGTYYIVPKMVAQACPEREDLILPGTVVCNAEDNVVGCVDFSRV